MDRYKQYKCKDFASDENFIRWVQYPDAESDAFWSVFIQLHPEQENEIYDARTIVRVLIAEGQGLPETDVRMLWDRIDTDTRKPDRKKQLIAVLSVAACVALLFGLWRWYGTTANFPVRSVFSGYIPPKTDPSADIQVILADNSRYSVSGNNADLQYDAGRLTVNAKNEIQQDASPDEKAKTLFNQVVVPWGKYSSITFSDGTRLWLNAGSRAVYPVEFADDNREIMIEGEAYFEVAHDAKRPFRVTTADITVTVLGTRFNVNAYAGETSTAVTLVSGSVEVGIAGGKTLLQPDRMLSINKLTWQQTLKTVDVYDVICWKDGLMQFHSENMENILQRIERHYAIRFVSDPETGKIVGESFVSGKMDLKEDITDVLKTIEGLAPVRCERINNQVLIRKK
ncbi:MAG: FecR domain-containing protein [Dysgonamonadaceae bacterium]|jgi:ferric-dicitrate binding protein FerR (iron transport regulator)|nr:FecR domain-containing protein [Dysgonamonadaceae bacterium]